MKMEILQECGVLLCVLVFAFARSENEIIKLRSPDSVSSQCHIHTTMSCKITSQDEPSISMFAWIGPGGATLCKLDERGGVVVNDSAVSCTYRDKQLDLTIRHTKPIHEGRYICKLRSNLGGKHSYTQLKLQECHNQLHYHIHDGNVTCGARGVYPEAHIHWFQGPQNLTHSSVSHPSIPAEDGTFEVASSLPHQHQSALNCSLWSPSTGRLLSSIQMSPPASPPQSRDTFSRATSFGAVGTTVTLFAVAHSIVNMLF